MQDKLTHILNDLYALDPALREQDSEVRALVTAFLAEKPKVELTAAFKQNLLASLTKSKKVSSARIPKTLPWWMFYVAPLGIAAAVILMLIPEYDSNFRPTTMPLPSMESRVDSVGDEESFDTFEALNSDDGMNVKRAATQTETDEASMMQITSDLPPAESFLINTQEPGRKVLVDFASLLVSGFVVIHTDVAGEFGEIIGVSAVLPAGLSEQISIPLATTTRPDRTFFAVLYFDNGDGMFEKDVDLPIYDASGTLPFYQMFSTAPDTPI